MAVPGKMTSKLLSALKGWPAPHALDFTAKLSANVTFTVPAGRCLHLNSSGELETGVQASGIQMPLFNVVASDDPSVYIDGGVAASDAGNFVAGVPVGQITCLVGSGPYELSTTEYVAGSYPYNTPLKAAVANTTLATGGVLVAGTKYTDSIVGIVSRGLVDNGYGTTALCFWTFYLPSTSA